MSLVHDIIAEATALGINTVLLEHEETTNLLHRLWEVFGRGPLPPARALWTCLREGETLHDPDAWKFLGDLIGEAPVVLIVEDYDGISAVRLSFGTLLSRILAETVGFVFYLVPPSLDYLLCFNDHDMLIGLGRATQWVAKQRETTSG